MVLNHAMDMMSQTCPNLGKDCNMSALLALGTWCLQALLGCQPVHGRDEDIPGTAGTQLQLHSRHQHGMEECPGLLPGERASAGAGQERS